MIKLLTAAEMRELDRATIEDHGLAGVVLMEHAGRAVAEAARDLAGGAGRHITLVCGKGNNGGDGFVAARWLLRWGFVPEVFLVGDPESVQGDARTNLNLLLRAGSGVETLAEEAHLVLLTGSLRRAVVVVDALLGTGLTGPPGGVVGGAIRTVNAGGRPVLAVDLPSGLNADSGEVYDPHIEAVRTVTFGAYKRGLALQPGADCAGEVSVIDIGLPTALLNALDKAPALVEPADVAARLPRRAADFHKGLAGRVLLIAGSRALGGAALLAARGAARGGAGLVTLALPACLADSARLATPETMCRSMPETDDGALNPDCAELLAPLVATADAVGIGPGLGTGEGARAALAAAFAAATGPLVLDADALNLLADSPELRDGVDVPLILTPHPGEAARLLKSEVRRVQADRLGAAATIARRYGATTLLKGAPTVVATSAGRLTLNPTGCPAMASGGMGDVLTGLLAALLAQGLSPSDAALVGAWLHGRAGELAADGADAGLLAGDLADALPAARREIASA
ncbi:MAG: NAD(P)H-hydrate dehydratase [Armatimonadetes bacterium]|nr:NAD(P)H-hydrate dehydratase [Armatimonadota bacterium]